MALSFLPWKSAQELDIMCLFIHIEMFSQYIIRLKEDYNNVYKIIT